MLYFFSLNAKNHSDKTEYGVIFFPQVMQIIHMIVIITGTVWMITDSGPINLEEPTPLTGMEKGTGSEIQEWLSMASSLINLFAS